MAKALREAPRKKPRKRQGYRVLLLVLAFLGGALLLAGIGVSQWRRSLNADPASDERAEVEQLALDVTRADPAVIFHSDFENGFAGWSSHSPDATLIDVDTDAQTANGGTKYLRASVSRTRLAQDPYISANAQFNFPRRVPVAYWRFYARFVGTSATPH